MRTEIGITAALGHIATRHQLLTHGASPIGIAAAVRSGGLLRVRRGYYATREASPAARVAVRIGGRLGGISAAATWGLWSGFDDRIHVVVPPNGSRLRPAPAGARVDLHWVAVGPTQECWRVSAADALRQVVSWEHIETAVACLDTALTAWGWTAEHLDRLFARAPAGDRAIAWRARPGSGSGCESLVRQRLAAMGLRVRQQVRIAGVGDVDLQVAGSRVLIEVDGFEFHRSREAFEEDRRRDAELAARGYVVVRLTYRRIVDDWPWCRTAVFRALTQFRRP